jgi:excisionase family DNA binding protein
MSDSGTKKMAYRIPEVVKIVGISRASVYREIRERRLSAVKAGSATLVTAVALQQWLSRLTPVGQ